jgi:hypothetical protein
VLTACEFEDVRWTSRRVRDAGVDMAERLTKSISAKVTEAEYAQLVAQVGDRTVSEWLRTTALAAVSPSPSERIAFLTFAEQLGLRSVVLNLCHLLSQGQPVTRDIVQHLIDQADRTKVRAAQERIAAAATPVVTS